MREMAVPAPQRRHHLLATILLISCLATLTCGLPPSMISHAASQTPTTMATEDDVRVECASGQMIVHIITGGGGSTEHLGHDVAGDNALLEDSEHPTFSGLVYPRGLSRNSSCMTEYIHQRDPITYRLPLRSCNTMSTETEDGGIEYHNTIVVQPHLKLVTNQGRGFHIRCRYETPEKTISFNEPVNVGLLEPKPLPSISELPGATMRIFYGDPGKREVAENVKIGDPLTLVVGLEKQDEFGIRVSDCLVRDGLGWGEQRLINNEGCPIDGEIMGMFLYSEDRTKAEVHFQAHKFPYTQSVYYQCNVKLCLKSDGSCEQITPPSCGKNRGRRQAKDSDGIPATIEVYSGLYVNEANELGKADPYDDGITSRKNSEDSICISQKNFAIGISIAGLILMLCVVLAIIILLARRRTKKTASVPGSSIYSGPYTNTAYSHSS